MKYCNSCGKPIDEQDRFCRNCGVPLTQGASPPRRGGFPVLTPEIAASYWKNFFGPFFKVTAIFFACFFGFSLLLLVFWFFAFRG
jgi:uncharacterized membrane protein YvbJ